MLLTLPLFSMISYISAGKGLNSGFFISILIFGLIGFYILRVTLWNTFGKEELVFYKNQCSYVANYGWFKDKIKTEPFDTINFAKNPVGYLEDNNYTLVVEDFNGDNEIICVTKMKEVDLEKLIRELKVSIEF
nr:hypothetical protein [uncultured Psychroserpens sp.]